MYFQLFQYFRDSDQNMRFGGDLDLMDICMILWEREIKWILSKKFQKFLTCLPSQSFTDFKDQDMIFGEDLDQMVTFMILSNE